MTSPLFVDERFREPLILPRSLFVSISREILVGQCYRSIEASELMSFERDPREVLDFWFGPMADGFAIEPRQEFWFKSTPQQDAEIRTRFEPLVLAAQASALDRWCSTPEGTLALVIVLDQFPRNIYRGTHRAFAFDAKAQQLVNDAVARGDDVRLPIEQRAFLYLPLEHQESRASQERCVELFERLHEQTPRRYRDRTGAYLRHAQQHRDIIRRFGRFPHRNLALGRPSTDEEQEYLRKSRGSFGQ